MEVFIKRHVEHILVLEVDGDLEQSSDIIETFEGAGSEFSLALEAAKEGGEEHSEALARSASQRGD